MNLLVLAALATAGFLLFTRRERKPAPPNPRASKPDGSGSGPAWRELKLMPKMVMAPRKTWIGEADVPWILEAAVSEARIRSELEAAGLLVLGVHPGSERPKFWPVLTDPADVDWFVVVMNAKDDPLTLELPSAVTRLWEATAS